MPVLGYWDIRGLAQPIRLLLKYVGEEFEEKKFVTGPAPDFDKTCWLETKKTLGMDFPNLPYYIDGDVKISQSNAILRYIARKHNLCGSTELERAHVDMMLDVAMDFRNGLVQLCYNPDGKDMLEDYLKNLVGKLKGFEKCLGNKTFFCGNSITFPDFHMYELLDQHRILFPSSLKEFPKLNAFLDRVEMIPQLKKYMQSPDFMKGPINAGMAVFGATA